MSRLLDWIERVAESDHNLAALLRGLVTVEKTGGALFFVWHSEFHRGEAERREEAIKQHLGGLSGRPIKHMTLEQKAAQDPMLAEALALGARVRDAQ